jgi:hypothetical protein
MKVATAATAPDFAAIKAVSSLVDLNMEARKLARLRLEFGALYQQYQDMLQADDEGMEVTITIRSTTKTLTLRDTNLDYFNTGDYYQSVGTYLDQLQKAILELHEKKQTTGLDMGGSAADLQDHAMGIHALALCLPEQPATTEPVVPTSRAARAA